MVIECFIYFISGKIETAFQNNTARKYACEIVVLGLETFHLKFRVSMENLVKLLKIRHSPKYLVNMSMELFVRHFPSLDGMD